MAVLVTFEYSDSAGIFHLFYNFNCGWWDIALKECFYCSFGIASVSE